MKLIDPKKTYAFELRGTDDIFTFQLKVIPRGLRDRASLAYSEGLSKGFGVLGDNSTAGEKVGALRSAQRLALPQFVEVFNAGVVGVRAESIDTNEEVFEAVTTDEHWPLFLEQVPTDILIDVALKLLELNTLSEDEKKS